MTGGVDTVVAALTATITKDREAVALLIDEIKDPDFVFHLLSFTAALLGYAADATETEPVALLRQIALGFE